MYGSNFRIFCSHISGKFFARNTRKVDGVCYATDGPLFDKRPDAVDYGLVLTKGSDSWFIKVSNELKIDRHQ